MKILLNFIGKLILYISSALTIIVILALISRIINPSIKGISNYDLKIYAEITIIFVIIYFALKLITKQKARKEPNA